MQFSINQRLTLAVAQIPIGAKSIALTITPAAGGSGAIEGTQAIDADHKSKAFLTPDSLGTWSFEWTAKDGGGLVVGGASGTFEVVAPVPVTMTATVTAAT